MNTMQLDCFLAVAQTLNFARAAEQLHVTQPAVTQQIHSLEAELKVRLFRRTTRTVELTQEGILFLGDAKAILEISDRAKKRAEYAIADTRESFIIGCHADNDIPRLAQTLQYMKSQFPNFYPIFRIVPFQHLYQHLLEETMDVILAFRGHGLKKAIHYQELIKVRVVGIMGNSHSLSQRGELHLWDLKQEPVIVLDPQKCPDEYRKFLNLITEEHSIPNIYFCDSVEGAVTLATAGYGLAILPDFFHSHNQTLTYLPIVDIDPISYGVYYKTLTGHPQRKAFVKLVMEAFTNFASP